MNEIAPNPGDHFLTYQTARLKDIIQEIVRCCEDRKLFESQKFGLPYAELKCLMQFQGERYLTVKDIALNMDVAKSRVTKLVNGLAAKSLVGIVDDPQDGRVRLISLTAAGRKKMSEIQAFQKEIHKKILVHFTSVERKSLLSRLEMLRSAMESVKSQLI